MCQKKGFIGILLLLLLLITACAPLMDTVVDSEKEEDSSRSLTIHFIDVGQGDAIWIQTPEGENVLVDAGDNQHADALVNYLRKHQVQRFEAVVGTHPHEDHIGGLDKVIDAFDVKNIYMPRVVHSTKTFRDVLDAVERKGLKITSAAKDVKIPIQGAEAVFLGPISSQYEELNDYSAILRLQYKNRVFLFMGDAGTIPEKELLQQYPAAALKADVLKIGHHGSTSATSDVFLKAVAPEYGVILCAKGNRYGHPHREVLEKLETQGVKVWRTDEQGTLLIRSDGKKIDIQGGVE